MSVRLFVANLPFQTSEPDLRAFFEDAGVHVDKVSIARDRFSTEARGFAWVDVNSEEDRRRAVSDLRGRIFYGRILVVAPAREKAQAQPG